MEPHTKAVGSHYDREISSLRYNRNSPMPGSMPQADDRRSGANGRGPYPRPRSDEELAELIEIGPQTRVVDVGSGRRRAGPVSCRDLRRASRRHRSDAGIRGRGQLSHRTRRSHGKCEFHYRQRPDMPFADASSIWPGRSRCK